MAACFKQVRNHAVLSVSYLWPSCKTRSFELPMRFWTIPGKFLDDFGSSLTFFFTLQSPNTLSKVSTVQAFAKT